MKKLSSKIYHLLPSLSIGGVESLVLKSVVNLNKNLEYFLVIYHYVDPNLYRELSSEQKKYIILINGKNKIIRNLRCLAFLFNNRSSIIITSLWRSSLLVYISSFFFRINKHVAFIHRSTPAHKIDRFFRRWQINHSILQIADSLASKNWVLNNCAKPNVKQVPLIFNSSQVFKIKKLDYVKFCFVGRLSKVKNIKQVLELMMQLNLEITNSTFAIYGTDQGELQTVNKFVSENKLDKIIKYKGFIMPWKINKELVNYHYIISLSHTEGMAMSIAEAMQLGVVPIVGNVGGPAEYCHHLVNSFIVEDYSNLSLSRTVKLVSIASNNEILYNQMSRAAYETFSNEHYESRIEKLLNQL